MAYISPLLTNLVDATKKSAAALDRDFSELEQLQNSVKSIKNFVFNAYTRLEAKLKVELAKIRSDIPVYTTSDKIEGHSYFAISPIEGLINFAHGNPNFAVSVALVEKDVLVAAVIYNPARDETFFAERGKGAFKEGYRNSERLRVSATKELENALVVASASYGKKENISRTALLHSAILQKTGDLRLSGCAALDLAYLAGGKFDAFAGYANHIASVAAGMLLVKEAGGVLRSPKQEDIRVEDLGEIMKTGDLIAANFNLNQKIFEIFNKA